MLLGGTPTLQEVYKACTGSVLSPLLPKQTWGFLEEGKAAHCSHWTWLLADKQEVDGVISVAIGAFPSVAFFREMKKTREDVGCFFLGCLFPDSLKREALYM